MDIGEKLAILAESAKYDVSCSSGGSRRKNIPGGLGNVSVSGICHSWASDGRCISLLKILMSNDCAYNCSYCINRSENDVPRASLTAEEIASLTMEFYRRNYIEGLFLSSAVVKNPDYTMERMVRAVALLREKHLFNAYIHLKIIPGANPLLVQQAGLYADRVSVNIELPSERSLKALAPRKTRENILLPMASVGRKIEENKGMLTYGNKRPPDFAPAGQSTQMIVGASPDSDFRIVRLSEKLYQNFGLKRVYYSAYVPVNEGSGLPALQTPPPLLREHRLYQADWLMRFYGFGAEELLTAERPFFDLSLDPKADWALSNIGKFPVEINTVPHGLLLRVPGIGPKSAARIVKARRHGSLGWEELRKTGAVIKRARYFVTCRGRFHGLASMDPEMIRAGIMEKKPVSEYMQPSLF